ncbi:Ig-like domain-containing protein [Fictibacillus aquaticus]|uniref:Ig-like domain-containing protein n=1 Tax=Fictibacillus aquaticus TaxID=2021314 RepID=UPI0013FE0E23|nr:Ig-like domain-containing protein [Fictibacillus aquaticus]
MRRKISILLVFLLLLQNLGVLPSIVRAASDTSSPVFESLVVTPDKLQNGEQVSFLVKASDDTKVAEAVLSYTAPSGQIHNVKLAENEEKTGWAGTLAAPAEKENGVWKLQNITLKDEAGNASIIGGQTLPEGQSGNFEVTETAQPVENKEDPAVPPAAKEETGVQTPETSASEQPQPDAAAETDDVQAPVPVKVEFDPASVEAGQTVTAYVTFEDESDIQEAYLQLYDPNYDNPVSNQLTKGTDGRWECKLRIAENAQPGKWFVSYISATDIHGNSDHGYYNDESPEGFSQLTVTNGDLDGEAPALEKVEFEKTTVRAGELNTVYVTASDNLSEVTYSYIYLESVDGYHSVLVNTLKKAEDGRFTSKFRVPYDAEPSEWKVVHVYLEDSAGNADYAYEENSDGIFNTFTVEAALEDTQAPTVLKLEFSQDTMLIGRDIGFTLTAHDDYSGVKEAQVTFISPSGTSETQSWLYAESDDSLNGSIYVPNYSETGEWKVKSITIWDNAGNSETYDYTENYPADFEVLTVYEDNRAPVVTDLYFEKETVTGGDTNTVVVAAEDDLSGVDSMNLSLVSPNGQSNLNVDMVKQDSGNLWKGEFTIPQNAQSGVWKINYLNVSDSSWNAVTYYSEEDLSLLSRTFTVDNPNEDTEPPVLTKVDFEKESAEAGETVNVAFSTEDASEVFYMDVELVNGESSQYRYVSGMTLQDDGTYKGEFNIPLNAKEGTWKVYSANIGDIHGNEKTYYYDEQYPEQFETLAVTNSNYDGDAPVVTAADFVESAVQAGGSNTLYLTVEDANAVDFVSVEIASPNYKQTEFVYAYQDGDRWRADFDVSEFGEPGEWRVSNVYTRDIIDNGENYYFSEEGYPSSFEKFTVLNDNHDNEAPVVTKAEFEKSSIQAGESNTVYVTVEDNLSGVDYGQVTLKSPTGKFYENTYSMNQMEDGRWSGTFDVNAYSEPGVWKVSSISFTDRAGNHSYEDFERDYPDYIGTFIVENSNYDDVAPELLNVEFEQASSEAGSQNYVYVTADDNLSGIQYMNMEVSGPSGEQRVYIYDLNLQEDGRWKGTVDVPPYSEPGNWYVSSVYISDNAGNEFSEYFGSENTPAGFEVTNSNPDTTAPVVHTATFVNDVVQAGESSEILLDISDDRSGTKYVEVTLQGPDSTNKIITTAYYNKERGKFVGEFYISQYEEPGAWRVDRIYVEDFSGNEKEYVYSEERYPETFGKFTVENGDYDGEAPTVSNVEFVPSTVNAGDMAEIVLTGEDNQSGISNAYVELRSPSGNRSMYASDFMQKEDGKWHADLSVSPYEEPGEWKISYVRVEDRAGNDWSENDPSHYGALTVLNDNPDVTAPSVEKVEFGAPVYHGGETGEIYVTAADDMSGVENLSVNLRNAKGNMDVYTSEFSLQEDGRWKAAFEIPTYAASGKWYVSHVNLNDKAGNFNGESYDLVNYPESFSIFIVENENEDVSAPVIQSAAFEAGTLAAGDSTVLRVEAEDNQSGVSYVEAVVISPSGTQTIQDMAWNADEDGKWSIPIYTSPYAEDGEWRIASISVKDNAGNFERYDYEEHYPDSFGTLMIENENADTEAPNVTEVAFNPSEVDAGETAEVIISAEDTVSGVHRAFVEMVSPSGNQYTSNFDTDLGEDGKLRGFIPISKYAESGEWKISYLAVYDKAGNRYEFYLEEEVEYPNHFGTLLVKNENPDVTPPVIESAAFEKDVMKAGETNTITITASDDVSGVRYMEVELMNKKSGKYLSIHEMAAAGEGMYKGEFSISRFAQPGEWVVASIYVGDEAGNHRYYNYDENYPESFETFMVENETPDVTGPQITSIEFVESTLEPGSTGHAIVTAEDDLSGVRYLGLRFVSPSGQKHIHTDEVVKQFDGTWKVSFYVPAYAEPGEWKVHSAWIEDNEENITDYHDLDILYPENFGTFTIVNETPDMEAPSVSSVSFEPDTLNAGDEGFLIVGADDDLSGVEYVNVLVEGPTGNHRMSIGAWDEVEEGKFKGTFSLNSYAEAGVWKVTSIEVYDRAGNFAEYSYDTEYPETFGTLNVISENSDITAPVFNGITFGSNAVKPGESMKVTVDATETGSGINGIYIAAFGPDGKSEAYTEIMKADENGKWSGELRIPADAAEGKWEIAYIGIQDNAHNYWHRYVEEGKYYEGTHAIEEHEVDAEGIYFTVGIDETAPETPAVNPVSDKDTVVTGRAEPKSTVSVFAGDTVLGTATADEQGQFTVSILKQQAGAVLTVTAADEAGNTSEAASVTVLDKTAPDVPIVNEVSDKDTSVTGKTEAKSTVTVYAAEKAVGTATATEQGDFTISIPAQKADTVLSVTAKDEAGNTSKAATVTVLDKTAPNTPAVNPVSDKDTTVTGITEAFADVIVKADSKQLGTAKANSSGQFSVVITPQAAKTVLEVTAADAKGNVSSAAKVTVTDKTAPNAPVVSSVSDMDERVTGTAEKQSTVTVYVNGSVIGSAAASEDGSFSVAIAKQKAGTKLVVKAKDASGNESASAEVTVLDKTAPSKPTVNAVDDNDTVVSGKSEPGAAITVMAGTTKVGSTKAASTGAFTVKLTVKQKAGTKLSVTAADTAGNTSAATVVTVTDKTAPAVPVVNVVDNNDLKVTGKTEAGAKVIVKAGTKVIGSATATSKGTFTVTIKVQKAGTALYVTATDKAGNISTAKKVIVKDVIKPAAPKVNKVDSNDKTVTGTAEAGSTITVKVGSKVIGTAKAGSNGKFTVKIKAQKANTYLYVTATDAAKNVSAAAKVKVVKA